MLTLSCLTSADCWLGTGSSCTLQLLHFVVVLCRESATERNHIMPYKLHIFNISCDIREPDTSCTVWLLAVGNIKQADIRYILKICVIQRTWNKFNTHLKVLGRYVGCALMTNPREPSASYKIASSVWTKSILI